MAKRYITTLLSERLGEYLDGLDSTDVKFTMSEATLQMENVSFKENALRRLKLPITIKHGLVRRLDVRVPWRNISSAPVQITFEGIDLLLTPEAQSKWEFADIYSEEYLQGILTQTIQDVILSNQTETQQSYFDSVKLKVLDNIKVKVSDVHIRVEHYLTQGDIKQSSFGILLRSFDIQTTDKAGQEIFHDRTLHKVSLFKTVTLRGLAVYLNPYDATMIHLLPARMLGKHQEVSQQMKTCIKQYLDLTDSDTRVVDDPSLIYILRPLNLSLVVQRKIEKPESITVSISLEQFNLQLLYNQLSAILVFSKLAQQYQSRASEQDKVRKYRFLKQPIMSAEQRWVFAIECIRRSIRTKNGALTAFKITQSKLRQLELRFKPMLAQFYLTPEDQRDAMMQTKWTQSERLHFWYTISAVSKDHVKAWVKDTVVPLYKKQQEKQTKQEKQGWVSWALGYKQQDEDDLDTFFDCQETIDLGSAKARTSLRVSFRVEELSLLLAKLQAHNRLEGIQMYNRGACLTLEAPTLNMDQFVMDLSFQEFGVNLVTIDQSTGNYQDCTSTIQQNRQNSNAPQFTLEIRKGDPSQLAECVELDIKMQIGSVVYKHYEDLVIRAKALSNVKIDQEIQTAAMGTLEDLRETAQTRLHELMYKRKNRFVVSIESPVLVIPIYHTFEGKHAPLWVIRTGNMLIRSHEIKIASLASMLSQDDVYEAYKVTLTAISVHYYESYKFYEKAQAEALPTLPNMPARHYKFTAQQDAHLQKSEFHQTLREFSVLDDFEIRVLLQMLKRSKAKQTKAPSLIVDVATTPIKINLSHAIYNQLVNFSQIFKISKQKQQQFQDEALSYNLKVRQQVMQQLVFQGPVRRLVSESTWAENHCVLSGRFIYFYKDATLHSYIDYLSLSQAQLATTGNQITITNDGYKFTFEPTQDAVTVWEKVLQKMVLSLHVQDMNESPDQQVNKRKTQLKRQAQNPEQPSLEMSVQMPSLQLQFLRMKLMAGTKIVQKPACFESWITIEFKGMKMDQVTRAYDDTKTIKFEQITLIDVTMPKVHQTLMFQTVQDEHSLVIQMSSQKEASSKYKGLLSETEVTLANVNFKFMPGSINQLIKLLRSTRLQTQPTQGHAEANYEQMQLLEANGEADDDLLLAPMEQPPLEPDQKEEQVQKIYESNCEKQKSQTSRMKVRVEGIKMSMLHHKHTMELFSLDASMLSIEMQDWYDHSSFACSMTALRLSDLTNHPYTYDPAKYFATVSQNLEPDKVTANEMIRCQQFDMSLFSYFGQCKLKHVGFNNRLVMRISPFRINFVQEVTMRFVEYFQQRFIDSLTMTDPYKNPKEDFEIRQQKQGLQLDKISVGTDFKQPLVVDYMDIQINKAQIFARDRPFSTNYLLISSPLIAVSSELVRAGKKFVGKPEIQVSMQRYCISLETINFWYGVSKHKKERLSLLKKTFTISVKFDALLWSEVLDKIDVRQMDKATQVQIQCEPVMLVLPQAVYTYLLRCSDLNFAWSDQLTAEFYFVKWIQMSEFYKQFHKVVAQRIKLVFPLLSLTLKHTDGSFIAELLLSQLDYSITRYLDGAQEQQVSCQRFFILGLNGTTKQAVVCPWNSPREVDTETLDLAPQTETQLSLSIAMKASGNKDIQVNIAGLKIFLRMPLFILLQGYFLNAWPEYQTGDRDKPVGFVGYDPDNCSRMSISVKVHQSLICLLNQPGYKSIAMLGEIEFSTLQENITQACINYNSLGGARHNSVSQSSQHSDSLAPCDTVYSMRLNIQGLTPYICSLSQLESGAINFDTINKRQLFSPLDLSLEQSYQLTPETDDDLQETGKWGVTTRTNVQVGSLQLKLSILDLHLILQVTAFASEQMAQETVVRLQEIERSIDRDSVHPLQKNQFFEQLVTKFQESNTDSVATVMERLSQTTEQFRRLTKGYTGHSFKVRETFLQFITQDILQQDIPIEFPAAQHVPIVPDLAESSESEEFFDVTEERTSYFTLLQSERAKSIHQKQLTISSKVLPSSTPKSTPKRPTLQKPKLEHEESDDEFHSARGSFESYRDKVEAAVDMFYSFHEKRPLLEDNPLFQGGEDDMMSKESGMPIESIRETMAELRASGSIDTSEESSVIEASPKPLEAKAEAVQIKGTMENILEDVKAVYCEQISVLAINDYNCGFTPVLQLNMQRINMNQSSKGTASEMGLVLPELLVNYYNLELGQWEPLLEPTQVILEQTTTQFDSKTMLTMKEPVNLNSTEECLKNLIFTYESWMQTPHFFSKPAAHKTKTINASKDSDDEYSITNKNFISQMRESLVRPSQPVAAREPSMMFSDHEEPEQKQANQQAVTPFSIANFTSRTIKVVRGGIRPGHFTEIKNILKQEVVDKPENQKVYVLPPSAMTDYAVTYDRLMGQGQAQKPDRNLQEDSEHQSEIEYQLRRRKLEKIKNNEMVGIQLSDLDYVAFVDLNRNTGQNPWVHEITPSVYRDKESLHQNLNDNEVPLLDSFVQIASDDQTYSQNRYRVFYGTILKGMRKFLVVRSPFCIVNKTAFPYEIRILDTHAKQIKHSQKLGIGETMGLDEFFYAEYQLQVKLIKAEPLRGVREEALWSQRVTFATLLKMQPDLGTGYFLTSADVPELCSCIKRQSGEINGTTDFVLVPPVTFKNFLPCAMLVRQRHSQEQYTLDQSQEKQFHVFTTTKSDRIEEFQLDLGVDGFLFAALDLRISQEVDKMDDDLEIADLAGNTVKIGTKISLTKAGFHVTVYAHVVILLETILVLPQLKIYYKSNFRERKPLANTEEISSRSYVLCNKDQDIVVAVRDKAQAQTYSYSVSLDMMKQTPFSVITAPGANAFQVNQLRLDFICTPTPCTLNFEDKIFTKVVQITPAYVLCNMTACDLEIAQADNINAEAEQDRILPAGQKREWYWPVGNMPDSELKMLIRSIGRPFDEESAEPLRDCRWSRPLSIYQIQDQISFPLLLPEVHGTNKKILLISKKVVGPTTFITIRELKSQTPPYLVRNLCPNLRLSYFQEGQQTPYHWTIGENDQSPYAHLDPQSRSLNCTFNMTIDKSARRWQFKTHYCFERQLSGVSFEKDFTEDITYQDLENKNRVIRVSGHNDGLTKCLTFRLVGESLKREHKLPKQQQAGIIRSTILISLQQLSISFVGYTKTIIPKDSWIKKGYQNRRERNEVALLTVTGLSLTHTTNYESNSQATNLEIGKFQIDNQSSQNPLFPTVLSKRDTSATAAPFLFFVLQQSWSPETNLRIIDFFDCSFAEYVLRLDDSFLVNVILTVLAAKTLNTSAQNSLHPIFLKDSFYGRQGYIPNYSPTKEPRRVKQELGVILAGETRFNSKLDDVHVSYCHWLMQDKWLEESGKLELKMFKISKIVIEVTFIFRTKDRTNKDEVSINFLQQSGLKLGSIDELLLKFEPFQIIERTLAVHDFSACLNEFYFDGAYSQVLKTLLTIKLIGSLPNLFRHVGEGIFGLVDTPKRGFERNWAAGVGGIFVGFGIFFKQSFVGLFGTTQVFSESWSELFLAACMDNDYAIKHEEEVLTERPKNFVEGLGFGARSALQSVPDAALGLLSRPIIEASRNGAKGFLLGLWQGIAGVPCKLISGGLDLFAKTSEGFKNTLRILEQKQKKGRVRMPRTFYGLQRRIKAFSEDDAFIVSNVLCQIKRGEFAKDHYVDMKLVRTASDTRAPHFLLLSEENLFLVEASQKALVWHVDKKHITKIQNMSNGLLINLKEDEDYAGRAQVGLPLDGQSSLEINEWFGQILADQI